MILNIQNEWGIGEKYLTKKLQMGSFHAATDTAVYYHKARLLKNDVPLASSVTDSCTQEI